jgi:hypothetical protein
MEEMEFILQRFSGRSRWPRLKLMEVTKENHGKSLILYRAKVTRFAGKVRASMCACHAIRVTYTSSIPYWQYRQLQRALRLKEDLQEVVNTREYAMQAYDNQVGDVNVKRIIMDDDGFWSEVVRILQVSVPLIKLLRMCDNQSKEVMGKVYHVMFQAGENLKDLQHTVPWAAQAAIYVANRWEYLHGRMHAAG